MARMMDALLQPAAIGEGDLRPAPRGAENSGFALRTVLQVLASATCYYLATRVAWVLCFPDSKVSLFFPPHAVLVAILLLVPSRHWWAYTLAAAASHFLATQQAAWPPLYALQCEAFDAVKAVLTAAGVRLFIKSPIHLASLRQAVLFAVIAVVVVPAGTALWGAAFTVSSHYGTDYWVEWRNLVVSNGVTTIVLVPAILLGAQRLSTRNFTVSPGWMLEACLLGAVIFVVGYVAFDRPHAGPDTSPALLYAPIPLLIWSALRFGLGGISASMLALTVVAIWGTMRGHGPFLAQTAPENALDLQLFLLMVATPLMLLAVAINDERRVAQALRVSDERMGLAVDSAQLMLWDWDATNDRVWMTDPGRKFFGFAPAEPLAFSNLVGRVHPDDVVMRTAAIQQALETAGSYEVEYRVVLPDGAVRWIAARGRYASPGTLGAPARILGVSLDITRLKEADAQAQQQREELAHLSRVATLGALSGSLGHELSQPLGSIRCNAEAGWRMIAQDKPDLVEIRAIFADITSEAGRAGDIIGRLRTMLRRGQVVLQPVNVNECIEELLRLVRADLAGRRVSVSNLIGARLPAAMTDRVQLQQVLLNLIVNACDAMQALPPPDRQLTLAGGVEKGKLRISVLDTGAGLPEDVETLFQPFQTTKADGLGVGLSICRTLVVSHGGWIWGERRDGRGAAFHVELSLAGDARLERC